MSFLEGSYLGNTEIREAMPPMVAPTHQPLAGDELIALPGGLVMSRNTLLILAAAAIILGIVLLRRK